MGKKHVHRAGLDKPGIVLMRGPISAVCPHFGALFAAVAACGFKVHSHGRHQDDDVITKVKFRAKRKACRPAFTIEEVHAGRHGAANAQWASHRLGQACRPYPLIGEPSNLVRHRHEAETSRPSSRPAGGGWGTVRARSAVTGSPRCPLARTA